MTLWVLIILAGIIAVPLMIEATRKRMSQKARNDAPGQFAKLSQGVTHYQWYGPSEGPVAVCIHGLTTPSFVWRSTAHDLADLGFRVLTYDLYGRGYSDRPAGLQDQDFFLRQLNDLLEDQGVEDDLTVIGYSMGGAIAACFAASQPQAIRDVVLLAPAGMKTSGLGPLKTMVSAPIVGTWLMLARYPSMLRRGLRSEAGMATTVENINALQAAELDWRGFVPAVQSSIKGLLSADLEGAHRTLQAENIPVMAIWGSDDAVIPVSAAELLTEWNPAVETHILDNVGHELTYTRTSEIVRLIDRFTASRR